MFVASYFENMRNVDLSLPSLNHYVAVVEIQLLS